jgi:hypothetical protein
MSISPIFGRASTTNGGLFERNNKSKAAILEVWVVSGCRQAPVAPTKEIQAGDSVLSHV